MQTPNVTALVVILFADGARLSFEHPKAARGWFPAAMARARELVPDSRVSDAAKRPVGLVVIDGPAVATYNANEVAELVGLPL